VLAPALEVERWEKILGRGYVVCECKRWGRWDKRDGGKERKGKGYGYRDLPACSKFEPLK
jgi:hypothetical protein